MRYSMENSNHNKPLNIIATTQGSSLDIFLAIIQQIENSGQKLGHLGAVVSFARHFKDSEVVRDFAHPIEYLKEWEVMEQARTSPCNLQELRHFDEEMEPGAVWSAILADRRLIYGRYSKYIQDYRVHFTDEELFAFAYHHLVNFNAMLDRIKPDVMIGFTPVTFGEMLSCELAEARGIPSLQLHSSRIQNYFSLNDIMNGTSRHFVKMIEKDAFKPATRALAQAVVEEAVKDGLTYEGVDNAIAKGRPFQPVKAIKALPGVVRGQVNKAFDPVMRKDNHDPGYIMPWLFQNWVQPLQERLIKFRLDTFHSDRMVAPADLAELGDYAFYPLHSEPEVALQVLGRPYHKNQIELMRNLAASLPAGMKLVVKEHPRSMGLRPFGYYKAMFEIPNLYLVHAHHASNPVVAGSKLVAVVSGTIGFEAIMMQKPVLLLGIPKYEGLKGKMIGKCYNLFELPAKIRQLLAEYAFDRRHVESFICAMVEGSVAVDLYSNLLKKPGRQSYTDGQVSAEEELKNLGEYTIRRIQEVMQP